VPISVIKREGQKESFDRSKLLRGIVRACEKTDLSSAKLETIVDEIETQLQQRAVKEVTSQEIGEIVLSHLQKHSEVAYVRFACVYRKFRGVKDFVEALNSLENSFSPSLGPTAFSPVETCESSEDKSCENGSDRPHLHAEGNRDAKAVVK